MIPRTRSSLWAARKNARQPAANGIGSDPKAPTTGAIIRSVEKVEKTTLVFKHEFKAEGVSQGKAALEEAGTPIRRGKSWATTRTKPLGWMDEREARELAKRNGWAFEKV